MQFNFQLSTESEIPASREAVQALLAKKLQTLRGMKCALAFLANSPVTDTATQKLESYAEKIERLTATVALVAHDFNAPNPYGATFKHSKTSPEQLAKLEKIVHHAPLLSKIKRFLITFPETSEYEALRFRQKLLSANLDFVQLCREPEKISGSILQAFEEYRREYAKTYREFLRAREESITAFLKQKPELERQIEVLAALDTLPTLGSALAPKLRTQLNALVAEFRPLALTPEQINTQLTHEPTLGGITFFAPAPAPIFHAFEEAVTNALKSKMQIISEKSVLAVLRTSRDPAIKKLTRLVTLAELTKLTRLFTPRTTPKILHTLRQLLNEKNLATLALGDFIPRHTTLDSPEKIRATVAELETFLTKKLAQAKSGRIVIT